MIYYLLAIYRPSKSPLKGDFLSSTFKGSKRGAWVRGLLRFIYDLTIYYLFTIW